MIKTTVIMDQNDRYWCPKGPLWFLKMAVISTKMTVISMTTGSNNLQVTKSSWFQMANILNKNDRYSTNKSLIFDKSVVTTILEVRFQITIILVIKNGHLD